MKPTVFISYTHINSDESDKLYQVLNLAGASPVNDKNELKYRSSLTEFMQSIRDKDYAALIISQAYLKSLNCMYEFSNVLKDQNYREKILPILRDNSFFDEANEMEIYLFWDTKLGDLQKRISEFESRGTPAPGSLIEGRKKAREIRNNLDEIFNFLSNNLNKSFSELEKNNFEELLSEIGLPPLSAEENSIILGLDGHPKIIRGRITYEKCSVPNNRIDGMNVGIVGGEIFKDDKGYFIAKVNTLSPYAQFQELNEKVGFDCFEVKSEEPIDQIVPGVTYKFYGESSGIIPANEPILDISTGKQMTYPVPINANTQNFVKGQLVGNKFSGIFRGAMAFAFEAMQYPPVEVEGGFEIELTN